MKRGIIYGYYQPTTNKWYVGRTINEKQRYYVHKKSAERNLKTAIARAFKKYGFDSFEYHILEELFEKNINVLNEKLNEREIFYIAEKDSLKNGYNLVEGGGSCTGLVHSEESRKKMSESRKGVKKVFTEEGLLKRKENNKRVFQKAVLQYTTEWEFVKRYESLDEASKTVDINSGAISKVCLQNGRSKTAAGFLWRYEEDMVGVDILELKPYRKEPRTEEWKKAHSERLKGQHKGNKFCLGKKHSEESKTKMSLSRKGKTYKLTPEGLKKKQEAIRISHSKKVEQYTADGIFMKFYESLAEASKTTNINRTCIGEVCNGRQKTAGGFVWKYKDGL